jgi:hypothetical protein
MLAVFFAFLAVRSSLLRAVEVLGGGGSEDGSVFSGDADAWVSLDSSYLARFANRM